MLNPFWRTSWGGKTGVEKALGGDPGVESSRVESSKGWRAWDREPRA